MGSFCPNHIKFRLKSTEELPLMTLKSDAKFNEKLTCGFKYDMRNLVNFHPTTQTSENFTSIGPFWPNYIRFQLKNREELSFKNLWFQKWDEELGDLSLEPTKVWKIVHCLSKVYNVSARKLHRNYVS